MAKYVVLGRNVNEEWLELGRFHLRLFAILKAVEYLRQGWQVQVSDLVATDEEPK